MTSTPAPVAARRPASDLLPTDLAVRAHNPVPVSVTLLGDYEVVEQGLVDMLRPYAERVRVLGRGPDADPRPDRGGSFDLALFDCYPERGSDDLMVGRLSPLTPDSVVAYTWERRPALVAAALRQGFRGYLGKSLPASALVSALERIKAGEVVVAPQVPRGADAARIAVQWSGADVSLTRREADVIALVTAGLSNQQIAERLYVGANSVKSYIRSAYRKMSVTSRSQAVLWGLAHGFQPMPDDGQNRHDEPDGFPNAPYVAPAGD